MIFVDAACDDNDRGTFSFLAGTSFGFCRSNNTQNVDEDCGYLIAGDEGCGGIAAGGGDNTSNTLVTADVSTVLLSPGIGNSTNTSGAELADAKDWIETQVGGGGTAWTDSTNFSGGIQIDQTVPPVCGSARVRAPIVSASCVVV